MRRGNWWYLLVALCLVLALIGVSLGGRIFRWEAIVWLAIGINSSLGAYIYSRWWNGGDV